MLRKRYVLIIITCIFLGLFGCTNLGHTRQISSLTTQTEAEEVTNTPLPTLTSTLTPTGTSTQTPTITSTHTPTPTPIIKQGNEVITSDNVDRIIQLGKIGKGTINDIAWSADGKKLVVGTGIGIYIYDSETLKEEHFIQIEAGVISLDVSKDGKTIITLDNGDLINTWDVLTGEKIFTLHKIEPNCGMSSVAFSPDGEMIMSFFCEQSLGNKVHIWDPKTGEEIKILYHSGSTEPTCLAISANGKIVATATSYGTINLWNIETGEKLSQPKPEYFLWWSNESITLSPDGSLLAYSGEENTIRLWDIDSGTLIRSFIDDAQVYSLWFSPDGHTLISSNIENNIRFWDINTGDELRNHEGHYIGYLSTDGNKMISYCDSGTYCIYDVNSWSVINQLKGHYSKISSLSLLSDGNSLTTIYGKYWSPSNITSFDLSTGIETWNIDSPFQESRAMAISPDGQIIAVTDYYDGTYAIYLINTITRQELHKLEGHTDRIYSLAFSPNGHLLASGGRDNRTILWDVATGTLLHTFYGNETVLDLAFSKDGQKLAVSSRKNASIWDINLGILQQELSGYYKHIFSYTAAFSPNGELLASGGSTGAIDLFQVSFGRLKYLEGHTSEISSLAFSPDGTLLASASHDNTIRLWDVSSGDELAVIDEHGDVVSSAIFSNDGRWLISGSNDGTIRFWGIPRD